MSFHESGINVMPPLSLPDMRHVETAVSPSRLIQRRTGNRTPEWKLEPDVYQRLMIMCGEILSRCDSISAFIVNGPGRIRKIFTDVVRLTEHANASITSQIQAIRTRAMETLLTLHRHLGSGVEASDIQHEIHSQIIHLHYKIDGIGKGNSLPLWASLAQGHPPIHEDVLILMDAA